MNKKLLALAVAAAAVSTAASAATIYKDDTSTLNMGGRVEVRANFSDANKDQNANDNTYKDASRVRLNIEGIQKYNDDLSFYGFTEYELSDNGKQGGDNTAMNMRYLFAGIQTNFGDVYYGHQDTSFTYLTNFTDVAENFSGSINEYNAATADRADNVLRYALSVDRLTVQAHIQGNSDADGAVSRDNNGYGIIAAYKLTDSLELGAGWASADGNTTSGQAGQDTGKNQTYTAAIKYVNDGLWLAATYEGGKVSSTENNEDDFNAADAYAGYTFGDNNVNLTYNYYDTDTLTNLNTNNIGIEYARYFGNATAFVAYKVNLLDDNSDNAGANTDDEAQVGLRYAF
ncbi:porin [Vibrio rumoiensis]|uniref:porin n=1 Tax=Vibrio rumoiensis TaxID=76258 RepID=UPI003AA8820C